MGGLVFDSVWIVAPCADARDRAAAESNRAGEAKPLEKQKTEGEEEEEE